MAESDDAQLQRTSLLGLLRNHVTLVFTLIPILLSGLRIFAVANGDRPTLVTLLSTLDVKAVLLGTFAWLLPTAFGVAAAICWIRWLQLRSVSRPLGAGQRTAIVWLAVCTTVVAVILFALAPVNDLFNLLLCVFAVYLFRKPKRNRVGQGSLLVRLFWCLFWRRLSSARRICGSRPEEIVLRNQPAIVGYVLAADPRYATVLKAADSTVQNTGARRRRISNHLSPKSGTGVCVLGPVYRRLCLETHTPVLGGTARKSMDPPYHYLSSGSQAKDQAVYVVMVTMIIA